MAKIKTYHTQNVEYFASLAKENLDGEIEFYERVSGNEPISFFFKDNNMDCDLTRWGHIFKRTFFMISMVLYSIQVHRCPPVPVLYVFRTWAPLRT